MLSRRRAFAILAAAAPAPWMGCAHQSSASNKARYRLPERKAAIDRGMDYLVQCSAVRENFSEHGADFLWCFWGISQAAADPHLKSKAFRTGKERAALWRELHAKVPPNADMVDLIRYAYGSYTADLFGLRDDALKEVIRAGLAKMPIEEFFGFDPTKEGPPTDLPLRCKNCYKKSKRGTKICPKCGKPLKMEHPLDLLCEAIITTYSGDRYGIPFGGTLADAVQWVSQFRPYTPPTNKLDDDFYGLAYLVTHVIYALNDYSLWHLKKEWLPAEYAFLRKSLDTVIKGGDFETAGEFIDSLGAFGVTDDDPDIQRAIDLILSKQNPDGSWGDPKTSIVYDYYHSTWTAVGGMMEIGWRGEKAIDPVALRVLQETGENLSPSRKAAKKKAFF